MEINWQQFGLRHNPYDTSPLFEGGELPLAAAYIIQAGSAVTQKEVASELNKKQSNVTNYYFRPLREAGIITLIEQKGRTKYWELTEQYRPLREVLAIRKSLASRANRDMQQLKIL